LTSPQRTDRPVHDRLTAAERQVPRQFTPDRVTGQLGDTDQQPTYHVYGTSTSLRVSRELGRLTTWGYLADTGGYGCGRYPQFEGKAGDLDLVAELRAVWYAIGHRIKNGPVTVITRTGDAICQLAAWQDGSTDLPAGYVGSTRRDRDPSRRRPMLEQLRRAITEHPRNLTVSVGIQAVDAPLAEGAETLAGLAEQWARNNLDKNTVRDQAAAAAEASLTARGRP
jgi:hypothetical protein